MGEIAFLVSLFMGVGGAGVFLKNFKTVLDSFNEENSAQSSFATDALTMPESVYTADALSTAVEVFSTFV
ncbi:hypothetical protein ACMX1E_01825 [Bartonella bacilliformis]|uniref:hypothetical protein n=1 Tax=Bartonella bacilliformis TaxID=774 RepID=UPI0039E39373